MDLSEFIKKIREEISQKKDYDKILSRLPHFHGIILEVILKYTRNYVSKKKKYKKMKYQQIDFFLNKSNDNIFSQITVKEDRDLYLVQSNSELAELENELELIKKEINLLENALNYIKETNYTIKNIIDYQKRKQGS
jgi:hypothetical protein